MLNLKKTAVAVLAFSSSAVFAGTMGPVCAPGNVTVPCEATAWDFGAQALYLQNVRGADLAYLGSTTVADRTVYHDRNDNWGWGFQIEGSYHFNTGNDFDINWYHYRRTTTQVLLNDTTDFDLIGNLAYRTRPQWDAVNFEFGQHVDFGEFTNIRFHAGAEYARLKGNDAFRSSAFTLPGAYVARTTTYNGFGPRVGADLSYDMGNGFAVYGKAATAVLIGTSKFSTYVPNPAVLPLGTSALTSYGSRTAMVPELEGKLGAKYTYAMATGDLTLDVGYMWINYFHAHHVRTGLFSSEGDMSLDGVYFGLKWVGNVA